MNILCLLVGASAGFLAAALIMAGKGGGGDAV